jgi:hypothetical protein
MITKSPKTALKTILGGLFFLSFIIVSCNDEKKAETPAATETVAPAPAPATNDTIGKGPMDTGDTKPVKELN